MFTDISGPPDGPIFKGSTGPRRILRGPRRISVERRRKLNGFVLLGADGRTERYSEVARKVGNPVEVLVKKQVTRHATIMH